MEQLRVIRAAAVELRSKFRAASDDMALPWEMSMSVYGRREGERAEEEVVVVVVVEQESCTTELGEKYNASVSKSLQCPRFLELGG